MELGSAGKTASEPKPHSKQGHRRKRTAFTARQLERMQAVFQWNKYPGVTVREALATELGISEASVQVRFVFRPGQYAVTRKEGLLMPWEDCLFPAQGTRFKR